MNEEPDNRALQLPARLYGYHCEQKTPHSEQEEDYGDEDQLHFNFLNSVRHSGGKDGLIGLKLDEREREREREREVGERKREKGGRERIA